jgi:hypothetical protein
MKLGMFYGKVETYESDFAWLKKHGFDAVIGSDDLDFLAAARRAGIDGWSCLGTFNPPDDAPEHLCVDIEGKPRQWFFSGCPNNPEVREYALARYRTAASRVDAAGVFCDGTRFASPASGLEAFCTCFCKHCAQKAQTLGYDFEKIRKGVTEMYLRLRNGEPFISASDIDGVKEWLAFRANVITDFIGRISGIVRSKGKLFGGFFFTPGLSRLVGQDYRAIAGDMDIISPMLYRNFNEKGAIAPINTELHALASWAPGQNPNWVFEISGLSGQRIEKIDDLLMYGVSESAVKLETARTRSLIGKEKKLAPIIWWKDLNILQTVQEVKNGGADGVQIFIFTEESKKFLESLLQDGNNKLEFSVEK